MGLENLRGIPDRDYRIAEGYIRGSMLLRFQAPADHDPTSQAAAEMVRPGGADTLAGQVAVENYSASLPLPIFEELNRDRPDIGHLG